MTTGAATPTGPQVSHVAEEAETASDQSLSIVARAMKETGGAVRIRVPLQLWDGKQYVAWRQQIWKIDVRDVREAKDVQAALEKFFELVYSRGPRTVREALIELDAHNRQSQQQEPGRDETTTSPPQ